MGCLFGLVFMGAGSFMALESLAPTLHDWRYTRDWSPMSATLNSVSGGNNFVEANYSYKVLGEPYTNDRVYLNQFNDNIGNYHNTLYRDLVSAHSTQTPIQIWVNPQNPSESIIDKEMRWGLFALMLGFFSSFILIGAYACYASVFAGKSNRKSRARNRLRARLDASTQSGDGAHVVDAKRTEYTSEQWQTRKGWETNRIRSGAKTQLWGIWFFAIFWNGISSFTYFEIPKALAQQDYPALLMALFPLAGWVLLYVAVKQTLEFTRFGIVEFCMDPYPGSIGGHVGGTIEIKQLSLEEPGVRDAKFEVTLECVYTYVSGSGKNRSRKEDIKWAERGYAQIQPSYSGINLAFRFQTPEGLPQSQAKRESAYTFWRLTVKADLPGSDLNRTYDIPVYNTGQKNSSIKHNISEQVSKEKAVASREKAIAIEQGNFHLTDLKKVARIQNSTDSLSIYFPPFRNLGISLFAAIFGGGFSFATFGINSMGGESSILMNLFMFIFSIPFAIVGIIGSVLTIYLPLNSLRTTIDPSGIKSTRSLLFIPLFSQTTQAANVLSVECDRSGSTGSGVNKIEHFRIYAKTKDNKRIKLAEGIDGKDLAEHFAKFLDERIQQLA